MLGDFNARSPAWDRGESTRRGRILARWAAGLDLILLNEGFVPTCVHPRGVSGVDVSWALVSTVRYIRDWRVAVDTESLSDHRYVFMKVLERIVGPLRRVAAGKHFPRCPKNQYGPAVRGGQCEGVVFPSSGGHVGEIISRKDGYCA